MILRDPSTVFPGNETAMWRPRSTMSVGTVSSVGSIIASNRRTIIGASYLMRHFGKKAICRFGTDRSTSVGHCHPSGPAPIKHGAAKLAPAVIRGVIDPVDSPTSVPAIIY
jgi:hypothetical protein